MSVLDWNESQVNQFFISLGLNRFEIAIREHALTGDVLVHLDNDLLKDIGIQSVGKRLTILKAIYKLKLKDDIPIEDGHWVPPLGDLEHYESDDSHSSSSIHTPPQKDSFHQLIQLRDERIKYLESEVRSIKLELQSFAARLMASTPNSPSLLDSLPRTSSTRATQDRHMREESISQLDILDPSSSSSPITSQSLPQHHPPASQDDPKTSSAPSPVPLRIINSSHDSDPRPPISLFSTSSNESGVSATPKPKDRSNMVEKPTITPTSTTTTTTPTSATPSTTTATTTTTTQAQDKGSSNPYKSFRVTLEDPCYKVLPAALKKYKIKEHYKNYVLFICYGKQERCLSYEEKPLLLFQKLKDAQQNPVFTLRHIRDIESPVSLALAKQARKREKKLMSVTPSSASSATTTEPQPRTDDNDSPNDKAIAKKSNKKSPPNLGQVEEASGFCIAIYPYISEGEDDLDVGVGDTFIIIGKSKGWWSVNRDRGPETRIKEEYQGWIPSGCLLETSQSFSIGSTSKVDYQTKIEPDQILSVSSSCYGLMDYKPKGLDELGFEINDSLKVYKKYNNWSYTINESKPDKPRGWAPSWLIGTKREKDKETHQASSPNSIMTNTSGGSVVNSALGPHHLNQTWQPSSFSHATNLSNGSSSTHSTSTITSHPHENLKPLLSSSSSSICSIQSSSSKSSLHLQPLKPDLDSHRRRHSGVHKQLAGIDFEDGLSTPSSTLTTSSSSSTTTTGSNHRHHLLQQSSFSSTILNDFSASSASVT